jgi:DNA-binding NarL/FixJ family response regulator
VAEPLQVVVVDDHGWVREGLATALRGRGFRVTGTAGSLAEAGRVIAACRPDLALVDIVLGGELGTDLAARMSEISPRTRLVFCTGILSRDLLALALASDAAGVVTKLGGIDELAAALTAAGRNEPVLDQRAAAVLERPAPAKLTGREAEVLEMLAQGASTREVADRLVVALPTVHTHVRNAIRRLGARNRVHAVAIGLTVGELRGLRPESRQNVPGTSSVEVRVTGPGLCEGH